MGRDLMGIDAFKSSIMRSDELLSQHGLKLHDMLMKGDESTFNDTLNSFVSIAAIQVNFNTFCLWFVFLLYFSGGSCGCLGNAWHSAGWHCGSLRW